MSGGPTPHGPGFSFVDAVEVDAEAKRAAATKRLDPALPFFADHFPGAPLMPGVLLVESGAQAAGCLWAALLGGAGAAQPFRLAQVVGFKFVRAVLPGETLRIEAALERDFGTLAQFAVAIRIGEELAAEGKVVLSRE